MKSEEEKEKEKQRYGNHIWNLRMFGLCREILVWKKCMEWHRIDV